VWPPAAMACRNPCALRPNSGRYPCCAFFFSSIFYYVLFSESFMDTRGRDMISFLHRLFKMISVFYSRAAVSERSRRSMFVRAAVAVEYAIVILIVSVSAIGTVALLGRDVEGVSAKATTSIGGAVANDPAPIAFIPPVFAPVVDAEQLKPAIPVIHCLVRAACFLLFWFWFWFWFWPRRQARDEPASFACFQRQFLCRLSFCRLSFCRLSFCRQQSCGVCPESSGSRRSV